MHWIFSSSRGAELSGHFYWSVGILVSILSTKEFGGNSLRFGGKPFFLKMGAWPLKKRAMTPLSRKKGVPAPPKIPKCTDQVFTWDRFGTYQEIPTEYQPKIPNWYITLVNTTLCTTWARTTTLHLLRVGWREKVFFQLCCCVTFLVSGRK